MHCANTSYQLLYTVPTFSNIYTLCTVVRYIAGQKLPEGALGGIYVGGLRGIYVIKCATDLYNIQGLQEVRVAVRFNRFNLVQLE